MANKFTASLTKTGANVESSYNTAPGTTVWFGKTQNFDVNQQNVTEMNRTQDLNREVHSIDLIQKKFAGPVMYRVQGGDFFLSAFGSLSTTGPVSGVYTHTFTTGNSLPSYTLYHQKIGRGGESDIIHETTGCKTNEFALTCSEGGFLEATNTVLAKDRNNSASEKTFTTSSVKSFRFSDIVNGEVTVDGNPVKITGYDYTRANTLSDEQEGELIAEPCAQELTETGTLTFDLRNDNAATPFRTGVEVPVVIRFTRGTDDYIELTHQVVFTDHPEPTGVEGMITVAAVMMIRSTTVVIKNTTATYTF